MEEQSQNAAIVCPCISGPPATTDARTRRSERRFFKILANYNGKMLVTLTLEDTRGATIRSFTLHLKGEAREEAAPEIKSAMLALPKRALDLEDPTGIELGMSAFQRDMRYAPAV